MKKIYILLVVLSVMNVANAQWVQQNLDPAYYLCSVYFTDANTGYAANSGPQVLKTTDGGVNWEVNWIDCGYGICYAGSVLFPNTDTGYIVGSQFNFQLQCTTSQSVIYPTTDGVIWSTTDGGTNWVKSFVQVNSSLYSVHFPNTHLGYCIGYDHLNYRSFIIRTTNGTNWGWCHNLMSISPRSVYFINGDTGYIAGDYGKIQKTTDGGNTWVEQISYTTSHLYSIHFTNADTGVAVGEDGTIVRTFNGGTAWYTRVSGTTNDLMSVDFTDADTGFAVGYNGTILKTIDSGKNWETQNSGTNANLFSVHFPSVDTGYAVGDSGIILKTTNGGGFPVGSTDLSSKSNAMKIYPNPSSAQIHIEIPTNGHLTLLDISGQQLRRQEITGPTTTIDVSTLPNGIYVLRIIGKKGVQVGKIIKW